MCMSKRMDAGPISPPSLTQWRCPDSPMAEDAVERHRGEGRADLAATKRARCGGEAKVAGPRWLDRRCIRGPARRFTDDPDDRTTRTARRTRAARAQSRCERAGRRRSSPWSRQAAVFDRVRLTSLIASPRRLGVLDQQDHEEEEEVERGNGERRRADTSPCRLSGMRTTVPGEIDEKARRAVGDERRRRRSSPSRSEHAQVRAAMDDA